MERYRTDEEFRKKIIERNKINAVKLNAVKYSELDPERKESLRQRKRLSRITGAPGYKPAKHDAHVKQYKAYVKQTQKVHKDCKPHNAHVMLWRKACSAAYFKHRYQNDPEFNAKEKLRTQLRKIKYRDSDIARLLAYTVKKGGWMNRWTEVLGYGMDQLVVHLKRTVPKGYKWEQFLTAELHIDHIIPRSRFDLNNPEDVRACWCLSNLRLLPAAENIKKRDNVFTLL